MQAFFAGVLALAVVGCDGDEDGDDFDPRLQPAMCQLQTTDAECRSCVADCCADCGKGSECSKFAACVQKCGDDFDCVTECEERHPDGLDAWMGADECVVLQCAEECGFDDGT